MYPILCNPISVLSIFFFFYAENKVLYYFVTSVYVQEFSMVHLLRANSAFFDCGDIDNQGHTRFKKKIVFIGKTDSN